MDDNASYLQALGIAVRAPSAGEVVIRRMSEGAGRFLAEPTELETGADFLASLGIAGSRGGAMSDHTTRLGGLARLDPETLRELEQAIADGMQRAEMARRFGIDAATLRRYIARRRATSKEAPVPVIEHDQEQDEQEAEAIVSTWIPISQCTPADFAAGGYGGLWSDDRQRFADIHLASLLAEAVRVGIGRDATVNDLTPETLGRLVARVQKRHGRWWALAGDETMGVGKRVDLHWREPRLAAARQSIAEERARLARIARRP